MITVVVPTLNAEATLAECLNSLRSQERAVDDIVVVDGGSTDRTLEVARTMADVVIASKPNRSLQRNIGWQASRSPIVMFVDADMVLTAYVSMACEEAFEQDPLVVGLVIPERSYGSTFWAHVKEFEREFYQGISWMEAARCFRRDVLVGVGGYDSALIGGEDWDLDERVRKEGRIGRVKEMIWHHEQDLTLGKVWAKKSHYASTLHAYAGKHPSRASWQLSWRRRVQLIFQRPRHLIAHPTLTIGLLVLGTIEYWAHRYYSLADKLHEEKPIT